MSYTKRGPFVDASPTGPYIDHSWFDGIEAAVAGTTAGTYIAPVATGVVATDTANLQNAITAAQTGFLDLYIPQGKYQLSAPLTWNITRGSLRGVGDVILDWYGVGRGLNGLTPFTGPALTITATGYGGSPTGNPLNHVATKYVVEHFKLNGPDIDYNSTAGIGGIDGILFTDPGIGVDFPTVRHLQIYGMRDGLTYGDNTWSQHVERCTIHNPHRYGVNLGQGTNAGEAVTLLGTSIFGARNAAGNAVCIYSPTNGADFRMIGGSLDYSDGMGAIYGGSLTFDAVHIEDSGTGAMFIYSQSSGIINVSFNNCAWDSSSTAKRPYIHQVLPGSGSAITVTFIGDKGGIYPSTASTWFLDSSNNAAGDLGISSTIRGWHLNNYDTLLGQFYNLLSNGDFGSSTSFVASPGVGGWAVPASGTWSIGAGGSPGNALKLVSSTSTTGNATQRIPLPANRQPFRIAGKMMLTAMTAGSIQVAVQFYAADGTTPILGGIRIGNQVTTVDAVNWSYFGRRFTPPPGAAYITVQLGCGNFIGTGLWDEIEVVPV